LGLLGLGLGVCFSWRRQGEEAERARAAAEGCRPRSSASAWPAAFCCCCRCCCCWPQPPSPSGPVAGGWGVHGAAGAPRRGRGAPSKETRGAWFSNQTGEELGFSSPFRRLMRRARDDTVREDVKDERGAGLDPTIVKRTDLMRRRPALMPRARRRRSTKTAPSLRPALSLCRTRTDTHNRPMAIARPFTQHIDRH
jgi:hypothetical protein